MIAFTKMTIKGFCAFGDTPTEIDLTPESVLILGENESTTAADSNGAGKSTIFKALTWCLFGETFDKDKGDDVVHKGSKATSVELSIYDYSDNIAVTIIRERKKRDTLVNLVAMKGKQQLTELSGHALCVEYVDRMLGMDWPTFKNTVMFCQNDFKRFADPSVTDAERKNILKKILDLDVLTTASEVARKRNRDGLVNMARLTAEWEAGKAEWSSLTAQHQDAVADSNTWTERQKQSLSDVAAQIKQLKSEPTPDALESELAQAQAIVVKAQKQSDKLGKECDAAQDVGQNVLAEYNKAIMAKMKIGSQINSLKTQIAQLDVDVCPVCSSDMKQGAPATLKKGLADKLRVAQSDLADATADVEVKQRVVRDAQKNVADLRDDYFATQQIRTKAENKVAEKKAQILQAQQRRNRLDELERKRIEIKSESNVFAVRAESLAESLERAQSTLDGTLDTIEKAKAQQELVEYWVNAFGQGGLINWAIQSIIPTLEAFANEYLAALTDGDINISLDTSTALKSGKVSDSMNISLDVEGCGNVKPSGGQAKKISLALSLALMALIRSRTGANIANLFLDEPDVGLDDAGKQRFYGKLLPMLIQQSGHIMVVTHDPNVRAYFAETIIVKRKGISSWA